MAAATYTTLSFALKQYYTDRRVENLIYANCPFMAMVKKNENLEGEATPVPLIYGRPQGVAGTVAVAQTSATAAKGKKFVITPGEADGSCSFGDKVMKASKSNKGAWLSARVLETDGLYDQMSDTLNAAFWGNGGGSLGVVAVIAGEVVTLTEPSQAINFEVGMKVVISANDGSDVSHTLRAGSAATVLSVNRETGQITFDAFSGFTGEQVGDHLFREGTFVGNTTNFITHGVQSFIYANSTPPTLYGMVRTDDPQRLAGCRVPAADLVGKSIEDRLLIAGSYMKGRYRGRGATHGFLHPEDWQDLASELSARGTRPLKDDSTQFGFTALEMVTGGSSIKLYADPFCPKGTAFLLRLENFVAHSLDKMIHPVDEDGLTILRGATSNDYEYRLVSYPALSCNAPGWSGRVPLV